MNPEQAANIGIIKANMKETVTDNPDMLSFYAKKKCKHCYGRGYITRSMPAQVGDTVGFAKRKEICRCVEKGIDTEARSAVL